MTKVLITTVTGTVGSALAPLLVDAKYEVYGATRNAKSDEAKHLAQKGVHIVEVTYGQDESLLKAIKGMNKVVLCMGLHEEHQAVADAWIKAIEAEAKNIEHVIYLSVLGASNPAALPEKWHALNETLLKITEVPTTFVRSNMFFQNLGKLYSPPMRGQGKDFNPNGNAAIAYVDTHDVARVLAKVVASKPDDFLVKSEIKSEGGDEDDDLLAHPRSIVEISGAEAITRKHICEVISKLAKHQIECVNVDPQRAKFAMLELKMADVLAEAICEVNLSFMEHQDGGVYGKANDSVKNLTGKAALTLEDYVQANLKDFLPSKE